jgi:mannose-6-phosphate isomerase
MSATLAQTHAGPAAGPLAEAHRRFRDWMLGAALPFWADQGRDAPGRGVRESLTRDGRPAEPGFKRMRVQARQIYAFSHAALLGWTPGEAVARDAYGFILQAGRRPGGGWVRRLDAAGTAVLDDTADLYDQAFVLFALAWYARLTGAAEPLALARDTADWLRTAMAGPGGGYWNTLPRAAEPRQQNPHMHLLEAALALFETSSDAYWAAWAAELIALFDTHLFDAATGTLGEFFTDDWAPAQGEAGDHVEPGHHYEWAWLLHQYTRLTGDDHTGPAARLYDFAQRHGCDPATGLVWDIVGRNGQVRARSTRLWPQTEAVKAHCVMAGRGGGASPAAEARIAGLVDHLLTRFLADCPHGAWRDRFDAAGQPLGDGIPTSSFYHVFMAYAELDGLIRGHAVPPG